MREMTIEIYFPNEERHCCCMSDRISYELNKDRTVLTILKRSLEPFSDGYCFTPILCFKGWKYINFNYENFDETH